MRTRFVVVVSRARVRERERVGSVHAREENLWPAVSHFTSQSSSEVTLERGGEQDHEVD